MADQSRKPWSSVEPPRPATAQASTPAPSTTVVMGDFNPPPPPIPDYGYVPPPDDPWFGASAQRGQSRDAAPRIIGDFAPPPEPTPPEPEPIVEYAMDPWLARAQRSMRDEAIPATIDFAEPEIDPPVAPPAPPAPPRVVDARTEVDTTAVLRKDWTRR